MMGTPEPMPADRPAGVKPDQGVEPDYAAEAEAMEELALAGFQLVHQAGPEGAPEHLTYVRAVGEHTDFVYLALREDAFSTAIRYPLIPTATNLEQASGEVPAEPLHSARPGSIITVIREVLRWPHA